MDLKSAKFMLEFDFRNLALNASSGSEKKMIVFLYFSDEIVADWERSGNFDILVCFEGFTQNGNRKEILRNYKGQKLDVPKS